ncbi:MAG: hypothetical protein QXU32_06250 [Nitrososphaerales archaeon]
MSTEKLYKRIESAGAAGIARMKLKKEFGTRADKAIEELISRGIVFTEKKGRALTYWSKENYMQHLLNSDPKFKLIFDMYSNTRSTISNTVSKINEDLNKKVQNMTTELISNTVSKINEDLNKKVQNMTTELNSKVSTLVTEVQSAATMQPLPKVNENGNGNGHATKLTLDQFKMEFDRTLTEIPTSIGWVELAMVRERICDKYDISKQNFYSLASQLFDQFNNRYELSSGGNEGVMVRGLVHGFVRCI